MQNIEFLVGITKFHFERFCKLHYPSGEGDRIVLGQGPFNLRGSAAQADPRAGAYRVRVPPVLFRGGRACSDGALGAVSRGKAARGAAGAFFPLSPDSCDCNMFYRGCPPQPHRDLVLFVDGGAALVCAVPAQRNDAPAV